MVFPSANLASDVMISCSAAVWREDVVSSHTSSFGDLKNAREMATHCFFPLTQLQITLPPLSDIHLANRTLHRVVEPSAMPDEPFLQLHSVQSSLRPQRWRKDRELWVCCCSPRVSLSPLLTYFPVLSKTCLYNSTLNTSISRHQSIDVDVASGKKLLR